VFGNQTRVVVEYAFDALMVGSIAQTKLHIWNSAC